MSAAAVVVGVVIFLGLLILAFGWDNGDGGPF